MPSASALQDLEAQHPAPPSRACTPLLWALGSALLLVSGAFSAYVGWSLRATDSPGVTAPEPPKLPLDPHAHSSGPPQGLYAQLVVQDAQLSTGALSWHSSPGLAGVWLAPGVRYNAAARELEVTRAGVYFVFLNLSLRRVVEAARGVAGSVAAKLQLEPSVPGAAALALSVDLPPPATSDATSDATSNVAAGFRGALLHLSAGQRLSVHLQPSEAASPTWQLDQGATLLGLFCVTQVKAEGLNLPPT